MSGLVSYDSSSDEEEIKTPTTSQFNVDGAHAAFPATEVRGKITAESEAELEGQEATNGSKEPLIGPTVPVDSVEVIEEKVYTPLPASPSERDTIRYLTQATHPMASIPDSPPGSPDPAANTRFKRFLELKGKGVHFNENLGRKSNFRNPSLSAAMMSRAVIEGNQYATSLPLALWDPNMFPSWAYKEELLKSQQGVREKSEATKKSQSAAGKRTIDFAPASNSGGSSRHSTPGQQGKRRKP